MHLGNVAVGSAALGGLLSVRADDGYQGDGNTHMAVDKNSSVKFGDKIPSDILASLADHCDAGTCSADSWTFDTNIKSETFDGTEAGTITVTVFDASYRDDQTIKDGIVDALKQLAGTNDIYRKDSSTGTVCSDPEDAASCEDVPLDQYISSSTFYIRINGDPASPDALTDQLRVHVTSAINEDDFSAVMCGALVGAGSALAGGLETGGATLAAGISLGSLVCGAF